MSQESRARANASPSRSESQQRANSQRSDRSDLWLLLWIGVPAAAVVGGVIAYADVIVTWARAQ
jgi:hypothetical protein